MSTKFAAGKYALQLCDVCGFRYKYGTLKQKYEKDNATGIWACTTCWEPSHPQLRLGEKKIHDHQGLRNARPDRNLDASRQIFVNDEALARELGVYDQLDLGE